MNIINNFNKSEDLWKKMMTNHYGIKHIEMEPFYRDLQDNRIQIEWF